MKKGILALICFLSIALSNTEASVFLYNDSPFKLKAVVVAANGTTLGEKVLEPQETGYFEDALGQSNPVGTEETPLAAPEGNAQYSMTPYSVFWYCLSGTSYSTCGNIGAGALSSPSSCDGPRYCKAPRKQQPPSSEDNQQE